MIVNMIIIKFLFNFNNFCVIVSIFHKGTNSGILFLTSLRAVVVAKPVVKVISTLDSFILDYLPEGQN